MKKTLAAALSSVLVLGLATSALAVHETDTAEQAVVAKGASKATITGNVRERGVYDKWEATEDSAARNYYDSRVQLGVAADQASNKSASSIKLEARPSLKKSSRPRSRGHFSGNIPPVVNRGHLLFKLH